MNKVVLIVRRELSSFMTTWMGYFVIGVSLLLNGMLFNAFAIGSKPKLSAVVLADFFYFSSGIGIVAAVLLSMRALAEEKQVGTIILYWTSPISERQLVYGKFFSCFVFYVILQALTLYMPGLIMMYGKVSFGHLASGYLGLVLLGGAVVSISLFASALSSNQLIAGVFGGAITVFLLILWIMSLVVDAPFRELFSYIALHNNHFLSFSRGMIHTKDIIYYLSICLFFLECSVRSLESRRMNR